MNVKYLFQYVELCKSKNIVASWDGFKDYYNTNKKENDENEIYLD